MALNYGKESHGFTYDVFLSFQGKDVGHKFIGYLLRELERKGINTFAGDDDILMKRGGIATAILKAIEESKILIVVLSENYASSTWCLDELVMILDSWKRNNKKLVFPIFYHVDPSVVRSQRDSYGEALTAHEHRFLENPEKVQIWRSALWKIANISGFHITYDLGYRYEVDFVEQIVKTVYAKIAPKHLPISQNLVGLEHPIEEVESLLDMKFNDDSACVLGIYGLGGVGKTELAITLYNKIVDQFEAACFLANVREKSNINGLEDLQKTMLSELWEEQEIRLGSTSKGINEIKGKLNKKKVLLVLDDVDDREQLNNLAGGCDWFGFGSRIIITTREKDLLDDHGVEKVYKMMELNDQNSLILFCLSAFGKSHPKNGYEDISSRVVSYAKGLPLALKVIGFHLRNRKLEFWEFAMRKYKKIPDKKIQDMLKISYDRLDYDAKQVFLDIACFFKGEKIEYVEKILEEFGATYIIEELVNKSLVTIEQGCLKMHDLIQDMGREIVRQEALLNPGKRSRLWFYEDVRKVLAEDSGSDLIQGIMLDPPQREEIDWSGTAFKKMTNLRILIIRNTSFSSGPIYLSNHLRLLHWEEYPSKSFPLEFHPTEIVDLNLCKSYLGLIELSMDFSCLTYMNFSYSEYILTMPDVSKAQNLRELRLDNCKNLIDIHESVGFLKNLAHFSVSGCTKLIKFLRRMFLPSLEVLDLSLCVNLEHFPDIKNEMNKPLKIYMINTAIEELPDSIGNLTGLVCIEITSSKKLRYLPSSLFMLPNVVSFKLGGCSQLRRSFERLLHSYSVANSHPTLKILYFENAGLSDEDLRPILNYLPKLEELIASENNFESLPECIKESIHLTSLDVSVCLKLRKIPKCINLRMLNVHQCVKLEHISELPSTIHKVDARYCFSLSRETSTMIWTQVLEEIRGLEIVMPQTEIPKWFDFQGSGGNPSFLARKQFPVVALALVFQDMNEIAGRCQGLLVELQLVINGQHVPHKGYYNFRIAPNHVLICDLRLLFNDKEWLDLDGFLEHEWNLVQVSYESTMTLSCWGVFVYKQGTNMEDVQFKSPDPTYLDIANMSEDAKDVIEGKDIIKKSDDETDDLSNNAVKKASTFVHQGSLEVQGSNPHLVAKEESVTHKVIDGENLDETIDIPDISSPIGPQLQESLTRDTSTMLWDQVSKEIRGLEIVMPQTEIPTWFDFRGNGGNPCFWTRKKFPVVALALVFQDVNEMARQSGRQCVELKLVINGQCVPHKGYYNLRISPDHVLVCDLRLLHSDEEWLDLDAFLEHDWNLVQVSYDSTMLLGCWGVFVYKQETNVEDVKFVSPEPDPKYSYILNNITPTTDPPTDPEQKQWKKMMESLSLDKMSEEMLKDIMSFEQRDNLADEDFVVEQMHDLMGILKDMSNEAEDVLEGKPLDENSILAWMVDTIQKSEDEKDEAANNAEIKPPMNVGEASTSGHQGSSEVQSSSDPQQQEMMEIFYDGMLDGLLEAHRSFPALEIETIMSASLNKANGDEFSLLPDTKSEVENPESEGKGPSIKLTIYTKGITNGLDEAKLSFPTLDIQATLDIVLNRRAQKEPTEAPPMVEQGEGEVILPI